MKEELEKEIRDLNRKLTDKEQELAISKDLELAKDREAVIGKCFVYHSQGQSQYYINVKDLRKNPTSDYAYLMKAERVVEYWCMLKGDYSFSERVNAEVFLNRMTFEGLKEVSEEQIYRDIEKLLKSFVKSYERKTGKTN